MALALIVDAKKGMSAKQLQRHLQIGSYRTAWYLAHRIRKAMEEAGRIALGRVVMHTRERRMAIEPRDKGLLAYSLRMHDEVVQPATAFEDIPDVHPDKRMIEIAQKIIEQQGGPFEPREFKDRYEEALRELIRRKERGEKPTVAPEPPPATNVINLMDALQKSLKKKGAAPAPQRAAAPAGTVGVDLGPRPRRCLDCGGRFCAQANGRPAQGDRRALPLRAGHARPAVDVRGFVQPRAAGAR